MSGSWSTGGQFRNRPLRCSQEEVMHQMLSAWVDMIVHTIT